MKLYQKHFDNFSKFLLFFLENLSSECNIYEPLKYIISLGGKRIRPIMMSLSTEAFGEEASKSFYAGTAIELFHNFSLIHDDIMDESPLRRGNKTVHEKWNINTAILSGDAIFVLAYKCLENYEPEILKNLLISFNENARLVCEGQKMDLDFETQNQVSLKDYELMIKYKTSVHLACALKMGAILANKNIDIQEAIYNFGIHLGLAFQIQDDYLDLYGDPLLTGKKRGNDILFNKKTYLYLSALENTDSITKEEILNFFKLPIEKKENNLSKIKKLFKKSGVKEATNSAIKAHTDKAYDYLNFCNLNDESIQTFKSIGDFLMTRNN